MMTRMLVVHRRTGSARPRADGAEKGQKKRTHKRGNRKIVADRAHLVSALVAFGQQPHGGALQGNDALKV